MATGTLTATHSGRTARNWAETAGRAGLVARGAIYLLVGLLAVQLALGQRSEQTDQRGALAEVADKPFGKVLLVALAVGFGAYALWRVARSIWGEERDGHEPHQRLADLGRAALHVGLLVSTLRLLAGDGAGTQQPGQAWSARLLADPWGRWVVGAVGAAIVVGGAWLVRRGLSEKFRKHLDRLRPWVVRLGVVGHVARGVAFGLIGAFLVRAAVLFDPNEPVGLDHALRELAGAPAGPFLLLAVAVGLGAFGAFSMAESQDRRVLDG